MRIVMEVRKRTLRDRLFGIVEQQLQHLVRNIVDVLIGGPGGKRLLD